MRIAIVLGTRPEIVKMSPIVRECQRLSLDCLILHTGQHYSYNMDKIFFEQLGLPEVTANLDVGSGSHGEQTGKMLIGLDREFSKDKPDVVLVEGDTNTVIAGALAAVKLGIKVGHVEAGLRSYDRGMPEEINRVLADHCSDYLFAPTEKARQILMYEGISDENIEVTGNTVVDALFQNLTVAEKCSSVLANLGLKRMSYFLTTVHRQENVDDEIRLRGIINGLKMIHEKYGQSIIYPVHPRTRKALENFGLNTEGLRLIDPQDYFNFLQLESNAKLVLTDSGGVQEETCVLHVPCVTLRDNTERPETLDVGSNVLAGTNPEAILENVKLMLGRSHDWLNPFGDGKAAPRIIEALRRKLE